MWRSIPLVLVAVFGAGCSITTHSSMPATAVVADAREVEPGWSEPVRRVQHRPHAHVAKPRDPVVVAKPRDPAVVVKPRDPVVVAKPRDPVVVAKPRDPVRGEAPRPVADKPWWWYDRERVEGQPQPVRPVGVKPRPPQKQHDESQQPKRSRASKPRPIS